MDTPLQFSLDAGQATKQLFSPGMGQAPWDLGQSSRRIIIRFGMGSEHCQASVEAKRHTLVPHQERSRQPRVCCGTPLGVM